MITLLTQTLVETVGNLVFRERMARSREKSSATRRFYSQSILLYDALVTVETCSSKACRELLQISKGLTPVTRVVVRSQLQNLARALDGFGDALLPLIPRQAPKNNFLHPLILPMDKSPKSWLAGPSGLVQGFSLLAPAPVLAAPPTLEAPAGIHAGPRLSVGRPGDLRDILAGSTYSISIPLSLPVHDPEDKAWLKEMFDIDSAWKEKAMEDLALSVVREEMDIRDRDALAARLAGVDRDLERLVELREELSRFLLKEFPAEDLLA